MMRPAHALQHRRTRQAGERMLPALSAGFWVMRAHGMLGSTLLVEVVCAPWLG
jgi:hypothetical protein